MEWILGMLKEKRGGVSGRRMLKRVETKAANGITRWKSDDIQVDETSIRSQTV